MKHGDPLKSEHRSDWQWRIGLLVAATAFAFGAFGLWEYESAAEHGAHPDAVSVFYHTLQLFILHAPHLEHPMPWQLHVGRMLAAGLFFAAAGKAFVKVFRDELLLVRLWLPWRRGHVVVCGLGDLGLRLALDGRKRRRFVVAIEKHSAPGASERARACGVLVIEGDARDPAQLRRARVERAEFLVAACPDDHTNVAVASIAGQFAQPEKRRTPLVCRLLIRDPELRAIVSDEALFPHTGGGYRVNFSDLDLEDTAARQALRRYPLDFESQQDDQTAVHLVVIGFGQIGKSLALQAARIGHFANEVGNHEMQLRITVADTDPRRWNGFASRYKNLQKVCAADFSAHKLGDAGFISALAALSPAAGSRHALVTYAICIEGEDEHNNCDRTNLRLGLELSKLLAGRPARVLIHQTSSGGFASLFPNQGRGSGLSKNIHAFGMEEGVYTWDVLLHESEDDLAKAVHENYQATSGEAGVPRWGELPEHFKESNRQAADHIPIKLRALGYVDRPLDERTERIGRFDEKQMELLAKMEHARWCAERFLAGWEYGKPTARELKINESLVLWNELKEKDRKKDWNQINAIPEILRLVGRGIYRKED
ncbi:MAG: NAD-binding protein [Acidobacteriota bacterium]